MLSLMHHRIFGGLWLILDCQYMVVRKFWGVPSGQGQESLVSSQAICPAGSEADGVVPT
jgi:hypothetical protein